MKYKEILKRTEEVVQGLKKYCIKEGEELREEVLEERALGQLDYCILVTKIEKKFKVSEKKAMELLSRSTEYNIQDDRDVMELIKSFLKEEE